MKNDYIVTLSVETDMDGEGDVLKRVAGIVNADGRLRAPGLLGCTRIGFSGNEWADMAAHERECYDKDERYDVWSDPFIDGILCRISEIKNEAIRSHARKLLNQIVDLKAMEQSDVH